MGCAPGSGCCDDCGGGHLGDLVADPTDMTGGVAPDCAFGGTWPDCVSPSATPATPLPFLGGMSTNTIYLIGGALLVALFATSKGR